MKVNYGSESNCAFGDHTLVYYFSEMLLKMFPVCHILMHIYQFVKPSLFSSRRRNLLGAHSLFGLC